MRAAEESPNHTLGEPDGPTYDAAHPGAPEAVKKLEDYAMRLEENAKRIEAQVAALKSEEGNAEEMKEQVAALKSQGDRQVERVRSIEEVLKDIESRLGSLERKVTCLEYYQWKW